MKDQTIARDLYFRSATHTKRTNFSSLVGILTSDSIAYALVKAVGREAVRIGFSVFFCYSSSSSISGNGGGGDGGSSSSSRLVLVSILVRIAQ
jgi:hypothetical protein